jgi:hypothetical protein
MQYCIGLCGQKQVGKDTVFEILKPYLEKELNKKFVRIAFADEVKNLLCKFRYYEGGKLVRITREYIEENKNNTLIALGMKMCIRDAMNNIGDRFREISQDIWIQMAFLNTPKDEGKVVTDIRYLDEAAFIKEEMKGINIKVLRDQVFQESGHRSEISFLEHDRKIPHDFEGPAYLPDSPYDYILRNNEDRPQLENKVRAQLLPFILNKWKFFI